MSIPRHHKRQVVCSSRAPYREGRKPKAVKVYTVNQESRYLLVQGVPAVGTSQELIKLFAVHGAVVEYRILDDYPAEHFTEVYLIKFEKIQAARVAKRKLDDWSFYGGVLHVAYAPENESVQETREKLQERRKTIAAKVRQYERDGTYSSPYPSSSQNASANQNNPSTSNTKSDHNRYDSATPAQKFQSETIHESDQHLSSETLHPAQNFDPGRPDMSAAPFYNSQAYQFPSETQDLQRFEQKEIVSDKNMDSGNNVSDQKRTEYFYSDTNHNRGSEQSQSAGSTLSHTDHGHYDGSTPSGSQEVQLKLPLPPKQMHHGMFRHNQRLQHYSYAYVPTAQAEFPVNYDARVGPDKAHTFTDNGESSSQIHEKYHDIFEKPNSPDQDAEEPLGNEKANDNERDTHKTMQEKIEENLKHKTDVVIKKFESSRPVPKFIPRQAQIKKKPVVPAETPTAKVKNAEKDAVNRELKRNAFTLGKPQGPTNPGSPVVKEAEKVEESINKTVKDIRKRMLQLSENKDLLTKKKKRV